MLPLNFGGHPALHRYNALLDRSKQAHHETRYRTQTHEMHDLRTKRFYRKWASALGICMVSWGQALTRFGATDKNFLLP
jgi:tRNA A37 threonylcarbamoyladenosine biosynthesis protein TsaE